MKQHTFRTVTIAVTLFLFLGCYAPTISASSMSEGVGKSEDPPGGSGLWPRFRARYHWENIIPNCGGGDECGSCIGFCIFWPIRLGPAPSQGDLDWGMSRADMFIVEDRVVIAPLDLPFDPGNGKVVIEYDVALGSDVAERLGFEEVKLIGGLYVVDYSFNDPYGRISVAAELIP